ncbi:MAG: peptidase T [Desulfobacteraceae bacterium 4572_88]|nr:MAG: peptidase T [Desulfobacteraceae bacterium 4572_88]
MISSDRLAETFKFLVEIDSESGNEANVSNEIRKIFESLGVAEIHIDDAGAQTGSNTGNLIAKFEGSASAPPLMLNAHMDTVSPGKGVKAILRDGVFTSDGTTILGADDKSAIAILIEILHVLRENSLPHGPLEIVLTTCEEVGLLGAKHLDFSLITAKYGYALDSGDTEGLVTRAPGANRFEFRVHGKDAHAGVAPEKGINAISLASKAIARLEIGRIDHETTCNIGIIEGGIATNIVPSLVTVRGEVRSHDEDKLDTLTNKIVSAFKSAVESDTAASENELPRVDIQLENDFSRTNVPEDHPVVALAQEAAANIGREIKLKTSGGGADANVFFKQGIMTGVLGTGMRDVHTVREFVRLDDMVRAAELVLEIIRIHSK